MTTSTSHSLTWQHLPCPKHHRQRARYDLGRAYGWYVVDYRFLLSGLFSWALTSTDWRPLGFLLFRVLNIGSDSRFDTIRAHFFQFLGAVSEWPSAWDILLINFLYGCDRFLDQYVALLPSLGHKRLSWTGILTAQILWVHNTGCDKGNHADVARRFRFGPYPCPSSCLIHPLCPTLRLAGQIPLSALPEISLASCYGHWVLPSRP